MFPERFRRTRMVVLSQRPMAYQGPIDGGRPIGAVLVSHPPGLAGILTDRDLAPAVLGGELYPKTTPLSEGMSEEVSICDISADVDDILRLMQENGVRRIPLTEGGQLVGLVPFDDLVLDGSVSLEALHGARSVPRRWPHRGIQLAVN